MATKSKKSPTVKPVQDPSALEKNLTEKRDELLKSQASHRTGELVNPHILRTLRVEIARNKTALRALKLQKERSGK